MAVQKQKLIEELRQAYNLKIRRTANAGVLINTDGVSILLDGVCKRVECYAQTPEIIKKELTDSFPDVVAFTHMHADHYDENYAEAYKKTTLRPVFGPEGCFSENYNGICLRALPTRHIGKADISHVSFIIEGSKSVWFMGDASPLEWRNKDNLPKPDVIIVPFAYANTEATWKMTKSFGAKDIIILHLPDRTNDIYGLWKAVEEVVQNDSSVHIPEIGETIILNQ